MEKSGARKKMGMQTNPVKNYAVHLSKQHIARIWNDM